MLVPLFGHTPGSVGVFVTVDSRRRYFLVGDAVWTAAALKEGRPKFWAARWLVDRDAPATQQVIDQIRAVVERDPSLTVIPSHDATVQDSLGYFPAWVQ
jgi:glyoxylase-like metal-dependent hydrolase (beta-lactamase superfamily II)